MKRMLLLLTIAATLCAAELRYRFEDPPAANFYDRSHAVQAGPVRDATSRDSDEIIGKNPMRMRGFKISWLQDGQRVGVLHKPTPVTMVDASGGSTRVTLKTGEPVVYDEDSGDILAVNRCANKVTDGRMTVERARIPQAPPPRVSTVDVNFPTEFAANVTHSGDVRMNHGGTLTLRREGGEERRIVHVYEEKPHWSKVGVRLGLTALEVSAAKTLWNFNRTWKDVARINATRGPQNVNVFKPTNTNTFEPPDVNVSNNVTNTANGGAGGTGGNATATGGAGGAGGEGGTGVGVGVGGNANANANANAGASAGANTPPPPVIIPPPPRQPNPPHRPPVVIPPPPPPHKPDGRPPDPPQGRPH